MNSPSPTGLGTQHLGGRAERFSVNNRRQEICVICEICGQNLFSRYFFGITRNSTIWLARGTPFLRPPFQVSSILDPLAWW